MNTNNFKAGAYASTRELAKHNNNILWPYCHGKYTATAVANLSEQLAQDGVKLTDEMAACIMHYFITTYNMQGPAYVILISLLRDNNIEAAKCFYEVYKVIPDDMGINAFGALCELLRLLGIDTNEKA